VAFVSEAIQLLALELIFLGDHLGAHELAEHGHAEFLLDAFGEGAGADAVLGREHEGQAHRHARHRFHTSRDHHVLRAAHHRLRRELHRLLGGAALPVDGDGGHALRKPGGKDGIAADLEGLLSGLPDAAHDHVLDHGRIDPGALNERVQHFGRHVGRMPILQRTTAPATGGAHRLDDISLCHMPSLCVAGQRLSGESAPRKRLIEGGGLPRG
jgi:hypothetical protein